MGFGSLPNSLQWLDESTDRLRVDHGLHGVAHWLAEFALAVLALRVRGGRQGE
jgi:hypothetical protein